MNNAVMLESLLADSRTQNAWAPDPVSEEHLRTAYDMAKWGPTSMNGQPMRLLFLRSMEAKERLKPALAPGNIEKVMTAPVIAIVAFDAEFYRELPKVFPHRPEAAEQFATNQALAHVTAFRNATLQAAYFMLALRAVGLDVGPMSGFDHAEVDRAFFHGSTWRVNFLCGIGRGDPSKLFNRLPRLGFDEVSRAL